MALFSHTTAIAQVDILHIFIGTSYAEAYYTGFGATYADFARFSFTYFSKTNHIRQHSATYLLHTWQKRPGMIVPLKYSE